MVGSVEPSLSLGADRDEASVAQQRKVLGDPRIAQVDHVSQLPDRELAPPQVAEDLLSVGFGNELKGVHHEHFSLGRNVCYVLV